MRAPSIVAAIALAVVALPARGLAAAPIALNTTEYGTGPTVVLVHGLGGNGLLWMPTARKLLVSHHVVMVDLPGHGDSPMPDPFSLEAVADALDAVLASQSPPGAVVVGQGMGGLVAMATLRRHPEHVHGLVLIDAGARFGMSVPDQLQKVFLEQVDQNYDGFLRHMFMSLGRDSAQDVAIHAQASLVPKSAMTAYLRELLNADESRALRSPKAPVLYIGSSRAWPDSLSWTQVARQRGYPEGAPIATRRIGNSAYWMMKDQPDSLAGAIAEFSSHVAGGD